MGQAHDMVRMRPEIFDLSPHGILLQKRLVRHLIQNSVAARHGLGAQTHRAAQAVLRSVVPHHREAEFLCQRRGGIVLRHHRHLREFLRRHRLQRTAQQTFSVHHSLQLIAPEAAAAARRHDQAADPQLRHANHPLSCVPVYQLQYAPSSFAVSLFRK